MLELSLSAVFFGPMQKGWDGENEEIPDTIGKKLNFLLTLENVTMGLTFLFFSLGCGCLKETMGMLASTVVIGLWLTSQILFGIQYQKKN